MMVSEEMAVSAAKDFANKYHFRSINLANNQLIENQKQTQKSIKHVLIRKDENEQPVVYLVNYDDGGFAVVPADKRVNPILAYSEKNKMPTRNNEPLPGGLKIWFNQISSHIDSLRSIKNKTGSSSIHPEWNTLLNSSTSSLLITQDIDPPQCKNVERWEAGPLLQTTWGQDEGYNNSAPDHGCANTTNERVLTGCVATAMAQVMRYHEHPSSYNYSVMPNGGIDPANQPPGTNEVAELMFDAGESVGVDWGCNGSGALTSDAEAAFENDFGYSSSVAYHSYDREDIVQQIKWDDPVILRGADDQFGGHAWVADGYRRTRYYNDDCTEANEYLLLHMNWGWENNGGHNGWYHFDDFSPDGFNFDQNIHQLVNIHS